MASASRFCRPPRAPCPAAAAVRRRRRQRGVGRRLVALGPQPAQLLGLFGAHRGVVDPADVERVVVGRPVLVDADDRLAAGVDAGLRAGGGLLDAQLGQPGVDGLGHAAGLLDLLDVPPGPPGQVVGQLLDVGRAAPRVDDAGGAGLLLQHQLGVAGDAGGEVGRQRQRLVERVGVQRLGVPLGRRHRLDAGADDVVEHVLRGERPARGLAVGAQRQRLVALRVELLDQLGPQQPGRRAAWRPP